MFPAPPIGGSGEALGPMNDVWRDGIGDGATVNTKGKQWKYIDSYKLNTSKRYVDKNPIQLKFQLHSVLAKPQLIAITIPDVQQLEPYHLLP